MNKVKNISKLISLLKDTKTPYKSNKENINVDRWYLVEKDNIYMIYEKCEVPILIFSSYSETNACSKFYELVFEK